MFVSRSHTSMAASSIEIVSEQWLAQTDFHQFLYQKPYGLKFCDQPAGFHESNLYEDAFRELEVLDAHTL